ncbi:MAG TPA: DNA helicase, partial [Dielma fastidiosa]|nr:DNA helicase [Dielma fastidiosa]
YLRSFECINHLYKKGNQALFAILKREEKEVRMLEFKKYISSKDGLKSLLDCFPIIISTNMSALKLGSCEPQFDLMIMDEASQCSNPYALLPMIRSKRALFVGDQNQLQPVIVMDGVKNSLLLDAYDIPPQYDYKSNSILSTMLKVDPLSTFILLRDHYRSHDKIIDFSNKKYYGSELHLCSHRSNPEPLKLIDIDSSLTNEKNTSVQEAEAIINEIRKGESQDVAVITPFRKQADLLERQLNEAGLDFVKVGTIHTFQGDEKQKIIVSSAVTKNTKPSTFNWLKNNQELINVAVTRARENLVLVTDMRQLHELSQHETNDFIELADYIAKDGKLEVSYKENEIFNSKVKNFKYYNTACEEEFLGTLMHLKTVFGQLQVAVKVKVSDVLDLDSVSKKLFIYGNQAHFDFVVYDMMKKPLLAIEVMGLEHFSEIKVRERDERKQEICRQCNLKLISIHNDYVRRYQYIKNIILNTLKSS